MKVSAFFSQHWHNLRSVWRAHPLETFWLMAFALPLLLVPHKTLDDDKYLIYWLPFLPYLVLMYKLRWHKTAYYIAGALPLLGSVILYSLWGNPDWHNQIGIKLYILNMLALLALLFDWQLKPNRAFLSRAVITLANIISALLVSGCLLLAILLIEGGIHVLFESQSGGVFNPKMYYVPFFVLTPLMFLTFERPFARADGESIVLQNRVIDITLNYIAAPLLLIFTLLIYVYTGKIILQGALPNGGVALIVGGYLAAGLITQLLQELSRQAKWQWLQQRFAWLALPPLILLWVGIHTRILAYGLTVPRIWLLTAGLLLTVFCLLSLRQIWRQYRVFAMILLVTGFLMGIVLPLQKIAEYSQQTRFEKMLDALNLRTEDGKIVQPLPKRQPENAQQWQDLFDQTHYLRLSAEEGEARYGQGYTQIINQSDTERDTESVLTAEEQENQNHRIHLHNQAFDVPPNMKLYKVEYISAHYDKESGQQITHFAIELNDKNLSLTASQMQAHLQQVFAKHNLNPKYFYRAEESAKLTVLSPDILSIPMENGSILLADLLWLGYDDKQGYLVSDIRAFALLQPETKIVASEPKPK